MSAERTYIIPCCRGESYELLYENGHQGGR